MARPRDNQRTKVLNAEASIRSPQLKQHELQRLANRITKSQWWAKQEVPKVTHFEVYPSDFGHRCNDHRSLADGISRSIPLEHPTQMNTIGLFHRVAHIIHEAQYGTDVQLHGPEFTKTMLEVVRRWGGSGDDAKKQLLGAYRTHRVKTRVYTPEAKEALKERAAAARSVQIKDDLRALLDELA